MIAAWTRQHTKHEAMEIIGAAGIPAGAVLDTDGTQSTTRRSSSAASCRPSTIRCSGKFKMVAWPVRFSGSPPPVKPAPLLGANNDDVLTQLAWPRRWRRRSVEGQWRDRLSQSSGIDQRRD